MTFKTSFYGIPADVRANTVIPLLVGPPGADATVADGSITNAKLANVATATFKGRATAGTGVPQDLTATQATALLNLADGSLKGLMSAADFTKLAGVASGATANTGTVTTVSVVTANGVSGSVANAGTTPAITLTLGAITPTSVQAPTTLIVGGGAASAVTFDTAGGARFYPVSDATISLGVSSRQWSNLFLSSTAAVQFNNDTYLYRDAANTPAFRNGTNAQTLRVYGTFTDASNHRRVSIGMTSAGVGHIRPEGGGTGASGNVLHISGLPTSNPGPGILWNNGGSVAIGT